MNLAVEIGQVVVYKSLLTCYYLFHLYFLLCHKKTKKVSHNIHGAILREAMAFP